MTRTGPGRARGGYRQFGSFGVPDLQSSEAREIGAVHLDSQHALPNFQSSEVVDARTAAHRTSMLPLRRRADHRAGRPVRRAHVAGLQRSHGEAEPWRE